MIRIVKATEKEIPLLVPLFDQYRVFYKQSSDQPAARTFLENRLRNGESDIFLAYFNDQPAGFTQLYSTFSSVSMQPVFILNDLYVAPEFRKKGIGEKLLNRAKTYCRERKFKGMSLETAVDNKAQYLYERVGWEKDSHCFHYFWKSN